MTKVDDQFDKVYVNLWGLHYPTSISIIIYVAILLHSKTQKTWVMYFWSKDKFVDVFQIWLSKIENKSNKCIKALCADRGGKFISKKLKDIRKKKSIMIKYTALYMYEENRFAKRGWRTIVIMKESLLVDNGFSIEFGAKAMDTANYLWNQLPTKS